MRSYNTESTRRNLVVVVGGAEADAGKQLAEKGLEDVHSVILFRLLVLMNGVLAEMREGSESC